MEYIFSDKISGIAPSAIREIFKALSDPSIISLAAGNPAPESFPISEFAEISAGIFERRGGEALQYSITEGYPLLRKQTAARIAQKFSIDTEKNDLIITSGGQQGIDLFAKVVLNEGDTVICENPSFIGALNAFRAYNAVLKPVALLDDGIDLVALEAILKTDKKVKFIYTIPTFQNPSGITSTLENRKGVYALAQKYGVLILEDNPYGELRFSGSDVPTYKSFDVDNRVAYCGSFSKILSAGMRVGFICAAPEIINKIVVAKQVNDVHTTIYFQLLVSEYLEKYDLDAHIEKIRALYREKCEAMLGAMDKNFDSSVKFTRPEGGIFLWCTLPEGADMPGFVKKAIEKKVAVVPGTAFLCDESAPCRSFRLNYSMPSLPQICEGIEILGKVIKEIL